MKLALIVTGGLHPSGREQVMPAWVALFERLARRHDVHAFAVRHLPQPARYTLHGFTVHDLGRPGDQAGPGLWRQWRALRHALRRDGPFDVVHGFWVDPAGALAVMAGRRFRMPSVVTCDSGEFSALDDIEYGLQRTARGRALVGATCRLATRVHVTTQYMEGMAVELGLAATRIPIGVDAGAFRFDVHREEGPPWRLLQVASLNRVKDQFTLIDAVAWASRQIDVRLDLVGEDTIGGALQAHAAARGVADRVVFQGYRPHDELAPFYRAAHLYVQSSRHEAAGAAVLDAAAAGVPIVGARAGDVAAWAADSAVAVGPNDAEALADAIVSTIRDPELRRAIAANARAFVALHDVEASAKALEAIYEAISGETRIPLAGDEARTDTD